MQPGRAVIIGSGVGGLTAAIALGLRGWSVTVLEQAEALTQVGAGVQIGPNGTRLLERLGVMERLEPHVFEPEAIEARIGVSGRRFMRLPMRGVALRRWGARYLQIHRADLIEGLRLRLEEIAPGSIKTGMRALRYEQDGDGIAAILESGDRVSGDLLIGADGIHSLTRAQMLGPDAPRYTGNLAWRALVDVDRLGDDPPPPTGCIWTGEGRHAVTTRIRGGRTVNLVGVVERAEPAGEGWTIEAKREGMLADFEGWHPTLLNAMEKASEVHRWGLYDRPPLPRWSDGRAILLGDAAHPMLPSLAQGAVQAMEDAVVLARCLDEAEDVAEAGAAYFDARIARVTRVQRQSAANVRLFHHRGRLAQLAHYGPIHLASRFAPAFALSRNDWLFGHEAR